MPILSALVERRILGLPLISWLQGAIYAYAISSWDFVGYLAYKIEPSQMDDFIIGPERHLRIDQFLIVSAILIVSLAIDVLLAAVGQSAGHKLTKARGEVYSQTHKRLVAISHLLTILTDRWPKFTAHLLLGIGLALQMLLVGYLARYAAFMYLLHGRGGPGGASPAELIEPILRLLVSICIFAILLGIYTWDTYHVWQFGPFRGMTSIIIAALGRAVSFGIVIWLHSFTVMARGPINDRQLISSAALGFLALISFVLPRIGSRNSQAARGV